MSNVNDLLFKLKEFASSEWAANAINAMRSKDMVFLGQENETSPLASVAELRNVYQRRLANISAINTQYSEVERLLACLSEIGGEKNIFVEPYLSSTHSVLVFLDASRKLLTCITSKRQDPGSGPRTFDFAMGR
jgi:hypothetical protein